MQAIEDKILSRIYGNGRGWAFSQAEFADIGTRSATDKSLQRLAARGTIRRVMRGLYDYPKHSERLGRDLSPDLDQVARALARKFGWRIQATGPAALNLLGLSTQVPGRIAYLSDGPDRAYRVGGPGTDLRAHGPEGGRVQVPGKRVAGSGSEDAGA